VAKQTIFDSVPDDDQLPHVSTVFDDDGKGPGYGTSKDNGGFKIRYNRPAVATHVARILIRHAMDYEAAVTEIVREAKEEVADSIIAKIAQSMEKSPSVQYAVKELLESIGIGDEAEKLLIARTWAIALNDASRDKLPALKLLGEWRGMGKKAGQHKPEPLVGDEVAAGLRKMGLVPEAAEEEVPEDIDEE
jgi:hypothetical protein